MLEDPDKALEASFYLQEAFRSHADDLEAEGYDWYESVQLAPPFGCAVLLMALQMSSNLYLLAYARIHLTLALRRARLLWLRFKPTQANEKLLAIHPWF